MLNFHPAANLLPAIWMTDKPAFEELCNDIATNGLIEPIWMHEGLIIDGRNRYMACRKTGVEPRFREWEGQGGDVISFVISLNLKRSHLTSGQKAMIAFHALALFEAEAKKRQGSRTDLQENIHERIHESEPHKQSLQLAAEATGTNMKYVSDIKAISKKAPELLQKIESGSMTIPEAKKQMNDPKPEPAKPPVRWHVVGPLLFAAAKMLRNEADRQEAIEVILRIIDDMEVKP